MRREYFLKLVGEALDSLPEQFRTRIHNVAVLVEDLPSPGLTMPSYETGPRTLVLGVFHGVPMTRKSIFDLSTGPDYIVLYQKNIEAVCSNDADVREQVRRTVIHEVGHYFGLSESELEGV